MQAVCALARVRADALTRGDGASEPLLRAMDGLACQLVAAALRVLPSHLGPAPTDAPASASGDVAVLSAVASLVCAGGRVVPESAGVAVAADGRGSGGTDAVSVSVAVAGATPNGSATTPAAGLEALRRHVDTLARTAAVAATPSRWPLCALPMCAAALAGALRHAIAR